MKPAQRHQLIFFCCTLAVILGYAFLKEVTRRPAPDTRSSISARGVRALNAKRYADAEADFQFALTLAGDAPSFQRGTALQNLAKLRFEQHRFADAEPLFREALDNLTDRTRDEAQLALILNDLAICRVQQGAVQEAVALLERAVRIDEESDPASREAIRLLRNYAGVLLAATRPADAAAVALRATALEQGKSPASSRPVSP